MFSTCSELTPRAPIPDGRKEQIMQLCAWAKKMQRRVKFIAAQKGGDSYVQDVFLTVPPNFHYWKGKCSEHRDALNWPFESEWSWRAFCPTWLCLSRHTDYGHLSFGTHNTSLCGQMGGCIWAYFSFDQRFYTHGPLREDAHKECIWSGRVGVPVLDPRIKF